MSDNVPETSNEMPKWKRVLQDAQNASTASMDVKESTFSEAIDVAASLAEEDSEVASDFVEQFMDLTWVALFMYTDFIKCALVDALTEKQWDLIVPHLPNSMDDVRKYLVQKGVEDHDKHVAGIRAVVLMTDHLAEWYRTDCPAKAITLRGMPAHLVWDAFDLKFVTQLHAKIMATCTKENTVALMCLNPSLFDLFPVEEDGGFEQATFFGVWCENLTYPGEADIEPLTKYLKNTSFPEDALDEFWSIVFPAIVKKAKLLTFVSIGTVLTFERENFEKIHDLSTDPLARTWAAKKLGLPAEIGEQASSSSPNPTQSVTKNDTVDQSNKRPREDESEEKESKRAKPL